MFPFARTISSTVLFFSGFGPYLHAQSPAPASIAQAAASAAQSANPTATEPPSSAKALELFRNRKFDLAAAEYQRIIDAGTNAPFGYAGLARVYLRQQKINDASAAAQKAIELGPKLAAPHIVLGEVYFRQGKIEEAAEEFRRLVLLNTSDARAYYGLYRVMIVSAYYHKAKALLDRAYQLDPKDPDILRAWSSYLPMKDRIQALEDELGQQVGDEEYRKTRERQLALLKEVAERPKRPCSLSTAVTSTETPLMPILADAKRAFGYGLRVKFNGTNSTLRLDTGASGFNLSPHAAEKAGIQKVAENTYYGFGDKGERTGYIGYADSIQVGELVFKDCYVQVFDKSLSSSDDGLLGPNVFSQFLVELNLPDQKLVLSKLPDDPAQPATTPGLETQAETDNHFHDRYIAPEMKSFFPVYHVGHTLLLPAKLNGQGPALLIMDTGSSEDLIDTETARRVAKVSNPGNYRFGGLSGEVKQVLRAQDVLLQFPGFTQKLSTVLAINLENFGKGMGIQPSGFLGFETLHMLDIKIDYRDGLVEFNYDAKRFPK